VGYATLITLGGTTVSNVVKSNFTNPSDQASTSSSSLDLFGAVDLSLGKLRGSSVHSTSAGASSGMNVILYDTLTFNQSAFQGGFGSSYNLPLSVHFEGTFTGTGDFSSSGAGGGIRVYSGNTVVDSSSFADGNSLIDFLYISGPAPVCADGKNAPDFNSLSGAFSFDVTCQVLVDAAHPSVKIFMNLGIGFNMDAGGSWNLDMAHSATLSADFAGRDVTSASGVFPNTLSTAAAVPEPATLSLAGAGLAIVVWRHRRRTGR